MVVKMICLRKSLTILVLVIGGLVNTACTKIGLFAANVPAHFNDAKIVRDIAYGQSALQKLDIYIPGHIDGDEKAPVLVFFYGGRWSGGSKAQYKFIADVFTKEGYIVVLPDYRQYPDVKFPAFAQDAARALAWVYQNIQGYHGDVENLYLAGHSAGAHLAALIATNQDYLAKHSLSLDIINGFVGLSGPYAFVPDAPDLEDMFGPPERYPLMRASNFVDGTQPPMLLIHGLDDEIVALKNAEKLRDAIRREGGDVRLVTYDGIDHVETVGALMWFWSYKAPVKDDMLVFFRKVRPE
tara:strand:+ start:7578 stop:8468 length:891 start_codon:yes stop_codon:yes gene_type:complete